MIGERDGLMDGNGKRERYMCAVMSKILHENKNKIHIYCLWRCSQAKIQFKSSQKTRWHARTRLGDSRFALITIFTYFLLHDKIEHKKVLLLGP